MKHNEKSRVTEEKLEIVSFTEGEL